MPKLSAGLIAIAAALALAVYLIGASALPQIGRPANAERRSRVVAEGMAKLTFERSSPTATSYGPSAVCSSATTFNVASARQALSTQAARSGVHGVDFDRKGRASFSSGALVAFPLGFTAKGSYSDVMRFLGHLAQERPMLFVSRLDLEGSAADATAKLEGRWLCFPGRS